MSENGKAVIKCGVEMNDEAKQLRLWGMYLTFSSFEEVEKLCDDDNEKLDVLLVKCLAALPRRFWN